MKTITLYHNPSCSKSQAALTYLQEHNISATVVFYADQPLSKSTILQLQSQLGFKSVREMMRTKENLYHQLNLDQANEAALLSALENHPILMERPIAVVNNQATIGRPLDNIIALISGEYE